MFNRFKKALQGRPTVTPPVVDAPPSIDPEAERLRGNAFVDRGELAQALACYQRAIALLPDSAALRVNEGYVLREMKRLEQARDSLIEATALNSTLFDAHYLLAEVVLSLEGASAAAPHFERALELQPDADFVRCALVKALFDAGRIEHATALVELGVARNPAYADYHHFRGNLHAHGQDFESAERSFRRALELQPKYAEVLANLALVLRAQGRVKDAAEIYRQALILRPGVAKWHSELGLTHQSLGELDPALQHFLRATQFDPADFDAWVRLGNLQQLRCEFRPARQSYERALQLRPDTSAAYCHLGNVLQALNMPVDALSAIRRAIELDPDNAEAHSNLGVILSESGNPEAALESFERALALDPSMVDVLSTKLFVLSFMSTPERYEEEARRYDRLVSALASSGPAWTGDRSPAVLRIGLVSGDLRQHPVGLFLGDVLGHMNRAAIEVVAYSTTTAEDELTERLKRKVGSWVCIAGMRNAHVADRIRDDGIHILVDLAGHTAHNRLTLFGWKSAPVQVTWLGYWASTGLTSIDYLLSDPVSTTAADQPHFAEKLWHLPDTRLCFTAPPERIAVASLPAERNGVVTFGSFQNFRKIGDRVLAVWARVMAAVPGSRLRLQSRQTGDPGSIAEMLNRLASVGISADRVSMVPPSPRDEYLAAYADVDIVLDTFPFTGGTTTCEALWMGVPTLTVSGSSLLARQGASMMTSAGLPDWVASDEDDFVSRATSHASNPKALADLRRHLRERVRGSALFDASRFAGHFEAALRSMWNEKMGAAPPRL